MDILILATSAKHSRYCVAGLDLQSNKLIRLISDDDQSNYALSRKDITYSSGNLCSALDIVGVENLTYSPSKNQVENYRIDNSQFPVFSFKQVFKGDIVSFLKDRKILESSGNLFMGSRKHFLFENEMKGYKRSLALYFADEVTISQTTYDNGQVKSKATIRIGNVEHQKISITDFDFFHYKKLTLTNTILVCSLPDLPYQIEGNNLYFKFIAKIIKTGSTQILVNEDDDTIL